VRTFVQAVGIRSY